jgi:hypothetical protein
MTTNDAFSKAVVLFAARVKTTGRSTYVSEIQHTKILFHCTCLDV